MDAAARAGRGDTIVVLLHRDLVPVSRGRTFGELNISTDLWTGMSLVPVVVGC